MTEQDLIKAGFERVDVSSEESGDREFYYYTYDFGNGTFSLISPANDELPEKGWYVEVFEDDSIKFYFIDDVL
jgi:hypothetical protein